MLETKYQKLSDLQREAAERSFEDFCKKVLIEVLRLLPSNIGCYFLEAVENDDNFVITKPLLKAWQHNAPTNEVAAQFVEKLKN